MGKISDLLSKAAVIRDATQDKENTAMRVGGMLVDFVQALIDVFPQGVSDATSITYKTSATDFTVNFTSKNSDGTSSTHSIVVPLASSSAAGLMSPENVEAINTLASSIMAEAKNRVDAEATINNSIKNETAARTTADSNLQGAISTETAARTTADSNLQGAISTETTARANADKTLQANIDSEAKARDEADNDIKETINTFLNTDASTAIDNYNEIIKFLEGYKDSDSLAANLKAITDRITGVEGVAVKELHLTSSAPINCTGAVPMGAVAGVEPAAGLYRVKTVLPSSATASYGFLVVSDTGDTIVGKKYTFVGYGQLDANNYIVPSMMWNIIHDGVVINHDVVQSAGTSTTAVMSQKAVGDYINSGARIGSLTETSSDDTWNLEFEVNDGSALTKKIKGSTLLNGLENTFSYGIEFDTAISSPNCTRIGNPELHRTLPIQSKMRGCLLDDSGTVVDYLDENDWSSNVLDGSKGQIMVELPKHYIKFETEGTKRRVRLSEYPLAGYHIVEKCYVSAYEATIDRTNNKLASVVNTTAQFRGGNNQADWDALSKTQLGKPATNISLTNFRAYARNRGSMEWNCYTYQIHREIYWLFVVEYATLNSQKEYNQALGPNGYHQGGLGVGATTLEINGWNAFNKLNPLLPCGVTNSLGNKSGVSKYTLPSDYGTSEVVVQIPKYRGIENVFGDILKATDGAKCIVESDSSGAKSEFYVCDNPNNFTSSGTSNYQLRGRVPREQGYCREIIFGEFGDIAPISIGGSSTSYTCDYFMSTIPASGVSEKALYTGGFIINGSTAGADYMYFANESDYTSTMLGTRLCFIPQIIN